MDVYHDKNIWGKGRPETKLTAHSVSQSFLWGEQEIFIPAVYTGKAGAVLDVCAKIPTEDMAAFLKKWDYRRRMSLKTSEEFEQIDADNPGNREFAVEISLDGTPLVRRMSSSLRWYPKNIIQMGNADPASGDGFENSESAEHFSTGASCDGETVKTAHPITGQAYTLTLHECEQTRHSFAGIGAKGMIYPEYCRILSYSITPEIDRSLFTIRDCTEGDKPKKEDTQKDSGHKDGPAAIFMAGKSAAPNRRTAVSSLHFEPVPEVQWRIVFLTKPKDDIKISFPIKA